MRALLKPTCQVWRAALLAAAVATPFGTAAEPEPLSADAARTRVAKARGPLVLDDVATVDAAGAAVLATHAAGIALDKIATLSTPAAFALALHGRQKPEPPDDDPTPLLTKLRALLATQRGDATAARDLIDQFAPPAPHGRKTLWLSLNGLATLEPDVALALAVHSGPLALDGVQTLSVDAARALALHTGELSLAGLTTLAPDVGRALAAHRGPVVIPDALHRSSLPLPPAPADAIPPPR